MNRTLAHPAGKARIERPIPLTLPLLLAGRATRMAGLVKPEAPGFPLGLILFAVTFWKAA